MTVSGSRPGRTGSAGSGDLTTELEAEPELKLESIMPICRSCGLRFEMALERAQYCSAELKGRCRRCNATLVPSPHETEPDQGEFQ
jgi:hypothetical protein